MCAIRMCAIGMCAIEIVSVLLCALSGWCALYAVRYRDPSPFTLCAIGMCAIGHYGQFTVCYRDVRYRTVRYRDAPYPLLPFFRPSFSYPYSIAETSRPVLYLPHLRFPLNLRCFSFPSIIFLFFLLVTQLPIFQSFLSIFLPFTPLPSPFP